MDPIPWGEEPIGVSWDHPERKVPSQGTNEIAVPTWDGLDPSKWPDVRTKILRWVTLTGTPIEVQGDTLVATTTERAKLALKVYVPGDLLHNDGVEEVLGTLDEYFHEEADANPFDWDEASRDQQNGPDWTPLSDTSPSGSSSRSPSRRRSPSEDWWIEKEPARAHTLHAHHVGKVPAPEAPGSWLDPLSGEVDDPASENSHIEAILSTGNAICVGCQVELSLLKGSFAHKNGLRGTVLEWHADAQKWKVVSMDGDVALMPAKFLKVIGMEPSGAGAALSGQAAPPFRAVGSGAAGGGWEGRTPGSANRELAEDVVSAMDLVPVAGLCDDSERPVTDHQRATGLCDNVTLAADCVLTTDLCIGVEHGCHLELSDCVSAAGGGGASEPTEGSTDEQLSLAELDLCGGTCGDHRPLSLKGASDKGPQGQCSAFAQIATEQLHDAGSSGAQMSCAAAGGNTDCEVGAGRFGAQRACIVDRPSEQMCRKGWMRPLSNDDRRFEGDPANGPPVGSTGCVTSVCESDPSEGLGEVEKVPKGPEVHHPGRGNWWNHWCWQGLQLLLGSVWQPGFRKRPENCCCQVLREQAKSEVGKHKAEEPESSGFAVRAQACSEFELAAETFTAIAAELATLRQPVVCWQMEETTRVKHLLPVHRESLRKGAMAAARPVATAAGPENSTNLAAPALDKEPKETMPPRPPPVRDRAWHLRALADAVAPLAEATARLHLKEFLSEFFCKFMMSEDFSAQLKELNRICVSLCQINKSVEVGYYRIRCKDDHRTHTLGRSVQKTGGHLEQGTTPCTASESNGTFVYEELSRSDVRVAQSETPLYQVQFDSGAPARSMVKYVEVPNILRALDERFWIFAVGNTLSVELGARGASAIRIREKVADPATAFFKEVVSIVPGFQDDDGEEVILFTPLHVHYPVNEDGRFNENYYSLKHEPVECFVSELPMESKAAVYLPGYRPQCRADSRC